MTGAINDNTAGIIEAVVRQSGKEKSYTANYQGIIEAILDWDPSDIDYTSPGSEVLPEGEIPVGNEPGELVVIPNADGNYFMYVFANGSWEKLHVTTEEVETAGSSPFVVNLPDGTVLSHQADINQYLDERITLLSTQGYDDTAIQGKVDQEIADRIAGDQALQDQFDALEPYDDSGVYDAIAAETAAREAAIAAEAAARDAAIAEESSTREGVDAALQAAIEAAATEEDFQQFKDDITIEQAAQDQALVDYKAEITIEQTTQNSEIEALALSDETQNNQINALETQIQMLAQARAIGEWTYQDNRSGSSIRPPVNKTFYGTHQDGTDQTLTDWSDLRLLLVDDKDLNDNDYTFSGFEVGDKIEILSADGQDAAFGSLASEPNLDNPYANILVHIERSTGGPREGVRYIISVHPPGNGVQLDLDDLDERYVNKSGDDITGQLRFKRGDKASAQLRISPNAGDFSTNIYAMSGGQLRLRTSPTTEESGHDGSHIVLDGAASGGGSTKIYKVVEPTSSDMAANKGYVDTKFVKKSGSTMTGHLKVTNPNKTDGTYLFSVEASGLPSGKIVAFRVTADGKVKAGYDKDNPFMASDANDVVTKSKLDSEVSSASTAANDYTDTEVANLKDYTDNEIAGISHSPVIDHQNSTPPSTNPRGTLLLTSSNQLYIYT